MVTIYYDIYISMFYLLSFILVEISGRKIWMEMCDRSRLRGCGSEYLSASGCVIDVKNFSTLQRSQQKNIVIVFYSSDYLISDLSKNF